MKVCDYVCLILADFVCLFNIVLHSLKFYSVKKTAQLGEKFRARIFFLL